MAKKGIPKKIRATKKKYVKCRVCGGEEFECVEKFSLIKLRQEDGIQCEYIEGNEHIKAICKNCRKFEINIGFNEM